MAEGLLRHLAGDRFEVVSAGTDPVGINPGAVEAMQAIGIDISSQRSKHVNEFAKSRLDYVITVCDRANESCPVFAGQGSMLHWSVDDPAAARGTEEERQKVFHRVRDDITERIHQFLAGSKT
jgi:arsenate reductase (thioredoxin)